MTNMCNFVKLDAYNRYDHSTIVPIYININYITSISEIKDNDEIWYMVYLIDGSFRMSQKSYDYLVNLLYGKEPENA